MSGRQPKAEQGFAVVAVLMIMSLVSLIVYVYIHASVAGSATIRMAGNRVRLEGLFYGGIETAAFTLIKSGETATNGFIRAASLDGGSVQIVSIPETSRIEINLASRELLAALFEKIGLKGGLADDYAGRILRWRSTSGQPFRHLEELRLIPGIPPDVLTRSMRYLTVYGERSTPQLEKADPLVRDLLRENGAPAEARGGGCLTCGAHRIFLTAAGVPLGSGHAEAVIRLFQGDSEPFRVLSFKTDASERYPFTTTPDQLR